MFLFFCCCCQKPIETHIPRVFINQLKLSERKNVFNIIISKSMSAKRKSMFDLTCSMKKHLFDMIFRSKCKLIFHITIILVITVIHRRPKLRQ